MLRGNLLFRFFNWKKHRSNQIVQYNSNKKFDLENQINNEIIKLDKKISKDSKELLEAQIVKLRSNFSKSNTFIERIGKNVYNKKLDESINWYQKQIKESYIKRRELQINIEKIKGIFWLNQIKRFLKIISIGFLILLSLFIFLSGFMMIIYLLPLIILIFLGYLLAQKKY